ncbi:uncharacterized protein LOC119650906 [Hermetia illucens]|uniref:uncharacterized protein LOC119650906 n=1 Tax=Hermetia illucens TaxID=343691 RepID=UPI0018CC47E5|nr:uncharacterized protein LOC119650906 [Hermetia illucens]
MDSINELLGCKPLIYIKTSELEVGKRYHITGGERMKTRYGQTIVVDLEGTMRLSLPSRYSKCSDNVLDDFNTGKLQRCGQFQKLGIPSSYIIDHENVDLDKECVL